MVSPYWKQIAMTNVKKFVSTKLYGNYLLMGKYIKNKHNLQNVKILLRLQKLGTSTQINQLATDIEKEYFLKSKIDGLVTWYEQFTGMDEVRLMQNRVIEAQNRLVQAQEKRRESTKALSAIQNKIKDLRAELDTTSKGEERYLQLITQEHAVLKEERNLNIQFQMSEKEERDCFSFLSSAVKESHEKERAQADRTKYWSVIGSIIGTVIGVVGSSINNEFKMRELRRLVRVSVDDNSDRVSLIKQHQQELLSLIKEAKSSPSKNVFKDEEILLHSVSNYQHESNLEKLLAQQTYEVRVLATIAVTVSIICLVLQKL